VLFRWHGIPFYSYPVLLYVGLVLGVVVGHEAARASGLDASRVTAATVLLVVPTLLGSRLLFVITHWGLYGRLDSVVRSGEGGAAMYGGLVLAVASSFPLLWALGLPWAAFWDVAMLTILTGMIPTRIGCLLNGCCCGRPTSNGMAVPLPNVRGIWKRRLPLQLYEAAWAVVLLIGALVLWPARPFDGSVFLATAAGYGAARLVFEPLREQSDRLGQLRVSSVISVGLVAGGLSALALFWPTAS